MLIAPRSCNTSSAAMVSLRMRLSAKARSSAMPASRWWHTISMSTCSSSVLTVYGMVGLVLDGRKLRSPTTRRMSGAWPPPAPSVWNAHNTRPLVAAMVFSTKPDSLSVSEWIATWVSVASATSRQLSMAAGVVPQSSCSLRPMAPALTCSCNASGRLALPLPRKPRFMAKPSAACSIRSMCQGPGVLVVARVPVAGPVPPPSMVVMPLDKASSICCGQMKWMWESMPPAVTMLPSQLMISVPGPMTMSTPLWVSGLPALPIATMRPPLSPMSALTMPQWSMMSALVITVSTAPCARDNWLCAMPSRMVLPPPNLTSSP